MHGRAAGTLQVSVPLYLSECIHSCADPISLLQYYAILWLCASFASRSSLAKVRRTSLSASSKRASYVHTGNQPDSKSVRYSAASMHARV